MRLLVLAAGCATLLGACGPVYECLPDYELGPAAHLGVCWMPIVVIDGMSIPRPGDSTMPVSITSGGIAPGLTVTLLAGHEDEEDEGLPPLLLAQAPLNDDGHATFVLDIVPSAEWEPNAHALPDSLVCGPSVLMPRVVDSEHLLAAKGWQHHTDRCPDSNVGSD